MATKPSDLPRWSETTGGVQANITEPTSGKKDTGWIVAEKPPAQYFNWLFNLAYKWIEYLDDLTNQALTWTLAHTFEKGLTATQSTTDANGLTTTGNGTGRGLHATGGATAPASWATQTNGAGVRGKGGVLGSSGVYGEGGGGDLGSRSVHLADIGVFGLGAGGGYGVAGLSGGLAGGVGVYGEASDSTNNNGVHGVGKGSGAGVFGVGTAGVKGQSNGSTGNGVVGISTGTGAAGFFNSTGGGANLNLQAVSTPAAPNDGDIWFTGTQLKIQIAGVTKTFSVS